MEYLALLLLITSFVSTIIFFFHYFSEHGRLSSKSSKLPPGPYPYPIIGNLLELLGTNPLQAFTQLSKSYGPIMTLKLGSVTTIMISSPQIAKEALHTNDIVLSSRAVPNTIQSLHDNHSEFSIIWLPTSAKWRTLRRACATKLFSPKQLNSTHFHRSRKVQDLLKYVSECCNKGEAFDFGEAILTTVINSLSNIFFSMDLLDCYRASDVNESGQEFKENIFGFLDGVGRPNISDFYPIFRFFDIQGLQAKVNNHYKKFVGVFNCILEERILLRASESKKYNDVLDSLLDLIEEENSQLVHLDVLDSLLDQMKKENSQLTHHDVLHLLADLFVAGVDSTSSTMEWAMAELLHHPSKLVRLREELEHNIHDKFGQFEESIDYSKFPYLRAIVKETLRLHPPAPFLVPHKSNDDVELAGFIVPKNAQILVNVWSIARDSTIWTNPHSFEPERFLDNNIDFKGKDFEFIPFGAGRRICPGLSLASRSLHFMLATLLYHFNWKLADELRPEDLNMDHTYGITLHKAQPLRVIPIKD